MLEIADRVHGNIGGLQEIERVGEGERAARVAAVGVEHQDFAAFLPLRTVQIHAERIVQGRPAVGLTHANPFHETRVVRRTEPGHANFRVEVDEGEIGRVVHRIHELHGGCAAVPQLSGARGKLFVV